MPQSLQPRRLWMQFLRQSLSGKTLEGMGAGEAVDLAVAFSRCRAAALYRPAAAGASGVELQFDLRACSAALRAQREGLEALLGPLRDGAALCELTFRSPASSWKLVDLLEQEALLPLRGVALSLECLAVSVGAPDGGSIEDGFLLAFWEEEDPPPESLDRAALAAMALSLGLLASEARLAEPKVRNAQSRKRAVPKVTTESEGEARRARAAVLRELESLTPSSSDPLTHLAPHSRLLRELDAAVAEAERRGEALALILVDADDLAAVNREHGPQAGDRVLQEIASILVEGAEAQDIVVRYGMEEFALLVHGGDTGQIRRRAQEIQKRVQERALPGPEGGRRGSVSVGVACLPDPLAASAAALRLKAEQALEMARQKRPGGLIIL